MTATNDSTISSNKAYTISTPIPSPELEPGIHRLAPAALAGVVLAGVALVILSAIFLWVVHFRQTNSKEKKKFRRASAVARISGSRKKHSKIEEDNHDRVQV